MREPVVVYLLHRYPELSQTFVRNEVAALRASGVDMRVFSLTVPYMSFMDDSWGGPSTVVPRASRPRAVSTLLWWLVHHPHRLARYVALARRTRGAFGGMTWRQLPALARTLVGESVTAVHTHFAWPTLPGAPLLGVLLGAPSSATVHANDIYVPDQHAATWLAALDRLVTVCRYNVEVLQRDRLWVGPVDVVPCGVVVPAEPPPLDTEAQRVVTVARLVAKKGVPTLVDAFRRVHEKLPNATLDIIGDGPMLVEVEAAVASAGLADHVRLLGSRGHDECLAAIGGASVFALACETDADGDSDALPVVLREAMARARPVVTTAVAGIPEIIDESTGWVVPPKDPEALAAALVDAMTSAGASVPRRLAARERVIAEGAVDRTAAGMRRVLKIHA